MTQRAALVEGRLDRGDGVALAWVRRDGDGPTLVFLPGFASDMQGAKAIALDEWAAANGRALLRFDYSGHGASGGRFTDGTIGRWTEDARQVIEAEASGPIILIGSSMGGWIALLLASGRGSLGLGMGLAGRVRGLVGIAAAPDFTQRMMWESMAPGERDQLMAEGVLHIPSQYGAPLSITRALIEESRDHLILDAPIPLACPVRLLHGQRDPDVPWEFSLRIAERVSGDDVRITLVKDGDHRLARGQDLALLATTLDELLLGENGRQPLAK